MRTFHYILYQFLLFRKKRDFLDLWGHYVKPACSEERVGERSVSTLNNILHRFPWYFFWTCMTYSVIFDPLP